MSHDNSKELQIPASNAAPNCEFTRLEQLGWKSFFSQQVSAEDLTHMPPVRVIEVHRSGLHVVGDGIDSAIPPGPDATVGDWFLFNESDPVNSKMLERRSVFERRAPGHDRKRQLIAANVDTVFIVSSCNKDFNIARLERYVTLAFEAQVTPIILLTKADLCDDPTSYVTAATQISSRVQVEALNALGDEPAAKLSKWCTFGQTVAFLGSSGVGKSTLVNALFQSDVAQTAAIRSDDNKGRHTTTHRQLHFTPNGCAVLDTPGMREIQLTDVETGIAELFDDFVALAAQCKFNDCQHEVEPGCAIQQAQKRGEIDTLRLERWRKLVAEENINASTLAARKALEKSRGKTSRSGQHKAKR